MWLTYINNKKLKEHTKLSCKQGSIFVLLQDLTYLLKFTFNANLDPTYSKFAFWHT